MGRPKLAKR